MNKERMKALKLKESDDIPSTHNLCETDPSANRNEEDLKHPNIVEQIDFAIMSAPNFLVLEFITGKTLLDELRATQIHWKRALTFALQILSAIHRIHNRRYIYHDLNPRNVIIQTKDDVIKLVDFGCAQKLEGRYNRPIYAGTPGYRSPEKILEKPPITASTDLFSFGVILYEMLANQPAFCGRDDPYGEPDYKAVDAAFREPISSCLSKDPAKRPSSLEMYEHLEQYLV